MAAHTLHKNWSNFAQNGLEMLFGLWRWKKATTGFCSSFIVNHTTQIDPIDILSILETPFSRTAQEFQVLEFQQLLLLWYTAISYVLHRLRVPVIDSTMTGGIVGFQADVFHRQGRHLRRKMWLQNMKVKLAVLAIIIVMLFIIWRMIW